MTFATNSRGETFEEALGLPPGRLIPACEELERLELGSNARLKRGKELAEVIVKESITATGGQFRGKSLEVERCIRQSLVEGVLIARHSIPPDMWSR
jgi:hypothetical protein